MLKSYQAIYDHGKIEWLSEPPAGNRFRMVVVVEQPEANGSTSSKKRRVPPPELKGSVQWSGDPLAPLFSEDEWAAMSERTARQIESDPEAFK